MARTNGTTIPSRGYTIERTANGFKCDHVEDESLAVVKGYINGWVSEAKREARCESIAAARYEDAAYGYD